MALIDYGNDVIKAESKVYDALREYERAKEKYSRQLTAMVLQSVALVEDSARLYEENDKLRKLYADLWRFTSAACEKYPQLFDPPAQGGQTVQLNALEMFKQRMEALGIEVRS